MRHGMIAALVALCAWASGNPHAVAPPRAHASYRMGKAPRSEFKVGARTYKIDPGSRATQHVRSLPPEHFDPTTRHERVEAFYRATLKERNAGADRLARHECGPFRWEFVRWTETWPVAWRARWAWNHRIYFDEALWAQWMAEAAFAAEINALQRANEPVVIGYLPPQYAATSPVAVYNDEFINATYNPVPFLVVLKLKSLKPDEKTDWIGPAAADSLIARLSSTPGMFLADQEQVANVLKDPKLRTSDVADPGLAAQIGKALDVEQVVAGSYVADGDKVLFNLRIVDVSTGAVQTGVSTSLSREHLLDEMPGLATSLATALGYTSEETSNSQAAAEKSLFDGKSLAGWNGDPTLWRVENGEIIGKNSNPKKKLNHDLVCEGSYRNFIFKARFKYVRGNSGIFFRTEPGNEHGYEADILTGCMGKLALYDKVLVRPPAEVQRRLIQAGEWNDYVITAEGDRVRLMLNGETVVDSTQQGPQEGFFRLQIYDADGPTEVHFKDIFIQELLGAKSAVIDTPANSPTHGNSVFDDPASPSSTSVAAKSFTNSLAMKFIRVEPGEFLMGSPLNEDGRKPEETQHSVKLTRPFMMAVTVVTQKQWEALMGNNPSHSKGDELPVENVSLHEATAFCDKLSQKEGKHYRIPTEAEWEYACRAGTTTAYPFGSVGRLTDYAWFDANSGGITHPVAQKMPNAWGLYDMQGNVWQWCIDYHAPYSDGPVVDPSGTKHGKFNIHVIRGGSWRSDSLQCRAAYRLGCESIRHVDDVGFRVCADVP